MKTKFEEFVYENMGPKSIPIGSFNIESGEVMVSDPCYKPGTWCQGSLKNVIKGKWNAFIIEAREGAWGVRVGELVVVKDGYDYDSAFNWQRGPFEVGVDSGQAGIYDAKYYRDDSIVKGPFKYREAFEINKFSFAHNSLLMKKIREEEKESGENYTEDQLHIRFSELEKEYKRKNPPRYRVEEYEWTVRDNGKGEAWYAANCVATLSVKNPVGEYKGDEIEQQEAGVIPFGCVSRSGYGDGSYECLYATIPGEKKTVSEDPYGEEEWEDNLPIIAIKIVYIGEEEMDDEDMEREIEAGNYPEYMEGPNADENDDNE